MEEVRKLVDTLSPRTAHQYRSYCNRYVEWLVQKGLVEGKLQEDTPLDTIEYANLPISSQLVHWHLIETTGTGSVASIRKCISSLKFLDKLCFIQKKKKKNSLTGGSSSSSGSCDAERLDEKYLENVTRIREMQEREEENGQLAKILETISANCWNPSAQLPEKYFRNCFEQLRFLVDFQWRLYTKMSYVQRSQIRIGELVGHLDNYAISLELDTWSQLGEYVNGAEPQLRSKQPLAIVPHRNPLVCPLVSLATYVFLRFHDAEGFSWREKPIVRGKSPEEYPREETLGNYYAAVFRYCRLNYKRREWFGQSKLQYPSWKPEEYEFFEKNSSKLQDAFPMNVPRDFIECFNLGVKVGIVDVRKVLQRGELLVQLFPEIESRKRRGGLDEGEQGFVKLIEVLKVHLLRGLPILYRLFPEHDLFKKEPLDQPDFKSFYAEVYAEDEFNDYGMGDFVLEREPTESKERGAESIAPTSDVFQLVQFQTVSNFEILLKLLSQIFDRLDMKKSSREFAIHQLSLVHDTLLDRIKSSRPGDEKEWVEQEDSENEEELANMVELLVKKHIKTQVNVLESRLDKLIDEKIDSKLESYLGEKPRKKLKTSSFALASDIDSVEEIILEWFTPNPTMGNECVHSMNKKDKNWRIGSEELYKERKIIVEFYVHLVNHREMDRYKAVDVCENLREGRSLADLARKIKDWKQNHKTFDGLADL